MVTRTAQRRYVRAACRMLEDAQQATSLDACNRLLAIAVDDLKAAEERHLAARVQDIIEGRADMTLLQFILNGLLSSYDLLPSA